tara:strand:+ start:2162 stop:2404 length:243 start_codon:yes stop_codon:yes gene_type:complete
MFPAFSNNDYVMTASTRNIKKNDVVVINAKNNIPVIKRIESLHGGEFQVSSDNKAYESHICNEKYKCDDILGKVIFKLPF